MAEPVTLDQIEALFARELSPLKEAVSSMETKLEDITLRLKVLEEAPAQSETYKEYEREMSIKLGTMERQFVKTIPEEIAAAFDEKVANQNDAKMAEMNKTHEAHSTRLINQLLAQSISHATSVHKGGGNSENRTLIDIPMNGEQLPFFADKCFRGPHMIYPSSQLVTHISENPFNVTCDTRAQIEDLYKQLIFQDKSVYQGCNSYLEYRFGNEFHKKLCSMGY